VQGISTKRDNLTILSSAVSGGKEIVQKCVCILQSSCVNVHSIDGKDYVAALPFQVSASPCFPSVGLLSGCLLYCGGQVCIKCYCWWLLELFILVGEPAPVMKVWHWLWHWCNSGSSNSQIVRCGKVWVCQGGSLRSCAHQHNPSLKKRFRQLVLSQHDIQSSEIINTVNALSLLWLYL